MTDEKKNYVTIASDIDDVKTIAITCRCGKRWTEKVPGFLDRTDDAVMLFNCPQCGQRYGRQNGKLQRLAADGLTPVRNIDEVKTPKGQESVDDDKLKGKIISPGSDLVN